MITIPRNILILVWYFITFGALIIAWAFVFENKPVHSIVCFLLSYLHYHLNHDLWSSK